MSRDRASAFKIAELGDNGEPALNLQALFSAFVPDYNARSEE